MLDDEAFDCGPAATDASESYRGPRLLLDGLSFATALIGVGAESDEVFANGAALALTSGLAIHSHFGRVGIGFLSLLGRSGLAIGGCAIAPACFAAAPPVAPRIALRAGALAAAGLDVAFLAERPLPQGGHTRLRPWAAFAARGITAGVSGTL